MGGCQSCSTPELPPNPEHIDLTHFELLKVVGKGGFGKVNAITRKFDGQLMALKRMAKCEVIKKESHIRMVWTERNIMSKLSDSIQNPFLVSLEHAFQNDKELFFVMEFMQGGDLRFHLTKHGLMTEGQCRFYAAEMVLALESMHRQKIIYRDFKPDNVLLDSDGHVRLSDFGLAVQLEKKYHYVMKGNAGTGGYLAPEVWAGHPYGISPDVWSFGITIYELLHGRRPYRRWNPAKNYIEKMKFHPNLSSAARAFIKGLLTVDPSKRLACGPSGWSEVKMHPFFAKIDWNAIQNKIIKPPIKPDLKQANCSNQADLADQLIDKKPTEISPSYQKYFAGFDYNIDFGAWLIKNEKKKEELLHKAEEAKRVKAEHRMFRKLQMEQLMKSGSAPMSPLSPSSSSGSDQPNGAAGQAPHGGLISRDVTAGAGQANMSISNNTSSLPTLGEGSHMLVDYLQDHGGTSGKAANGSAGPSSTRPRMVVNPGMHSQGFDATTPVASGVQGSWQLSQSEDSQTHESEFVNPHTGLGLMMAQNHISSPGSHSLQDSNVPTFMVSNGPSNSNEAEDLLKLEDDAILRMTQHAHHASGPSFDGSIRTHSGGTGVSGFSQIQLPVQETRISEEAELALAAFKENQRRERHEAKRKHQMDKHLKHRTSLTQALLSVVRSKPSATDSTPSTNVSGTSPSGDKLPNGSDEEDNSKTAKDKLAERLQKDRANIRKIIHGDSAISHDVNNKDKKGSNASMEVPGHIRSVLASHPESSTDADVTDMPTPIFPYSTSGIAPSSTSSSTTTTPMNKMTVFGVPRFTNSKETTHHPVTIHPSASAASSTSLATSITVGTPVLSAINSSSGSPKVVPELPSLIPARRPSTGSRRATPEVNLTIDSGNSNTATPTHAQTAGVSPASSMGSTTPSIETTMVTSTSSSSISTTPATATTSTTTVTNPSLTIPTISPPVRHRIHVTVRQPNGEIVRSSSIGGLGAAVAVTTPSEVTASPSPASSTVTSSSSAVVTHSPRVNFLDQWSHITTTIKKYREGGRKIQLCIFFDYDGTLTPIVAIPACAVLSPSVRRSLTALLPLYPTAILTGRSLLTVSTFLDGVDSSPAHPLHLAASHGFEILLDGLSSTPPASDRVKQVGSEFIPILEDFHEMLRTSLKVHQTLAAHLAADAITLENNKFSLSVHYRNLPQGASSGLSQALELVLDTLLQRSEFKDLQRFSGKMVFEIKPRMNDLTSSTSLSGVTVTTNGWHKGCAMDFMLKNVLFPSQTVSSTPSPVVSPVYEVAPRRLSLDSGVELLPIYCGDDVTDEDVFRYMAPFSLCAADTIQLPALSIYVQSSEKSIADTQLTTTAANFTLRNTDEVHQLLQKLVEFAKQS